MNPKIYRKTSRIARLALLNAVIWGLFFTLAFGSSMLIDAGKKCFGDFYKTEILPLQKAIERLTGLDIDIAFSVVSGDMGQPNGPHKEQNASPAYTSRKDENNYAAFLPRIIEGVKNRISPDNKRIVSGKISDIKDVVIIEAENRDNETYAEDEHKDGGIKIIEGPPDTPKGEQEIPKDTAASSSKTSEEPSAQNASAVSSDTTSVSTSPSGVIYAGSPTFGSTSGQDNTITIYPPQGLVVSNEDKDGIELKWNPDSTAAVRIYRRLSSEAAFTKIAEIGVTQKSYKDVSASAGWLYYYVVTAVSATGKESAYSDQTAGISGLEPSERVLVLANSEIAESVEVAEYYQKRRAVPAENILALPVSQAEEISGPSYADEIEKPLSDYLSNTRDRNGIPLKDKILFIATTYGVPYKYKNSDGTISAVDARIQGLFGETPDPDSSAHFTTNNKGYIVSRLDGQSAEVAKGIIDKALYAEKYLDVTTGAAYFDKFDAAGESSSFIESASNLTGYYLMSVNRIENVHSEGDYKEGECRNAVLYYGWQDGYNANTFEWKVGAVGCAIGGDKTLNLRSEDTWLSGALADNITAAVGFVGDVRDADPFTNFIGPFMRGYSFAEASTIALVHPNLIRIGDPLYTLPGISSDALIPSPPQVQLVDINAEMDIVNHTITFDWEANVPIQSRLEWGEDLIYSFTNGDKDIVADGEEEGWRNSWAKYGTAGAFDLVFDSDKNSNVIRLQGTGGATNNSYVFQKPEWNTSGYKNGLIFTTAVRCDAVARRDFDIAVKCETTGGIRYIKYATSGLIGEGNANQIYIPLNENLKDGKWHNIIGDLKGDLQTVQPEVDIISVQGIYITTGMGNLYLDDIGFLKYSDILVKEHSVTLPIASLGLDIYKYTPYIFNYRVVGRDPEGYYFVSVDQGFEIKMGSISGNVRAAEAPYLNLEGIEATFQLRTAGGNKHMEDYIDPSNDADTHEYGVQVALGRNGSFTLSNVLPGTYDLTVKLPNSLMDIKTGIFVGEDSRVTGINFSALVLGDLTGNNIIDASDRDLLLAALGSEAGDENYNPLADLNRDGEVNEIDLAILDDNLGRVGYGGELELPPIIKVVSINGIEVEDKDRHEIQINENYPLEIVFSAYDTNGDKIDFAVDSLSQLRGAVLTDNKDGTARFSWTPDWLQIDGIVNGIGSTKTYALNFTAGDDSEMRFVSTPRQAVITVTDIYDPMQISGFLDEKTIKEEESITMKVTVRGYPATNIGCTVNTSRINAVSPPILNERRYEDNGISYYEIEFTWTPTLKAATVGETAVYPVDFTFSAEKSINGEIRHLEDVSKMLAIRVEDKQLPPEIATGLSLVREFKQSFVYPDSTDEYGKYVAKYGKYLFVTPTGSWGGWQDEGYPNAPDLVVFDISDPRNPVHVKDLFVPITEVENLPTDLEFEYSSTGEVSYYYYSAGLNVQGNLVYLYRTEQWYAGWGELVIFDVSQIENNIITQEAYCIGFQGIAWSLSGNVIVKDGFAFLPLYNKLYIQDVRNPADILVPQDMKYILKQEKSYVKDVFVRDGKAYIADQKGVGIYDLLNTRYDKSWTLFDIFIGGDGYGVYRCENTGTPQSPQWENAISYSLSDPWNYNYSPIKPTFCDIDADGDYDLFMGESKTSYYNTSGRMAFYENVGGALTFRSSYYDNIDVGDYSAPAFCDIDADGDYDLFIGEKDGNINFYRNSGNASSPSWTLVTANYNSIDVGDYSTPAFCDIDGDDDYDMFIGELDGTINFYENTGTPNSAGWAARGAYNSIDAGTYSAPAFYDKDNDGDYDLFVGAQDGSIYFYENTTNPGSDTPRPYEVSWTAGVKLSSQSGTEIDIGNHSAPAFYTKVVPVSYSIGTEYATKIWVEGDYFYLLINRGDAEPKHGVEIFKMEENADGVAFEKIASYYAEDEPDSIYVNAFNHMIVDGSLIYLTVEGRGGDPSAKNGIISLRFEPPNLVRNDDLRFEDDERFTRESTGSFRDIFYDKENMLLCGLRNKSSSPYCNYLDLIRTGLPREELNGNSASCVFKWGEDILIRTVVEDADKEPNPIVSVRFEGLPDGLDASFDTETNILTITGNNLPVGEHSFVIYASDGANEVSQEVKIKILPPPPPVADFAAVVTTGNAPLAVSFQDKSIGVYTEWQWDFGDNVIATDQNPTHIYNTPGTYTVELTITNPGGEDTKIKENYITVAYPPPAADFTASPASGITPITVNFTDKSSQYGGTITNWAWDFGDGVLSGQQSPVHAYNTPGVYPVSLTVTGPGGTDTETKANYINAVYPPPIADFEGSPRNGIAPLAVQFTDKSVGYVANRLWNFGDGQTSTADSPAHTYNTPGIYTVTLAVTGLGGVDTETKTDYLNVAYPPPVADFMVSPATGDVPLTVNFTDTSTGTITDYLWDFGDGTTSTDKNPVHIYNSLGTFTVKLKVTGPGGTDTKDMINGIIVTFGGKINKAYADSRLLALDEAIVLHSEITANDFTSYGWVCDGYEFVSGSVSPTEGEVLTLTDTVDMREHASYFTPGVHEVQFKASNEELDIVLYSELFTITILAVMDSSVIQGAIDAAPAGVTVLIDPGVYVFSADLWIKKNLTLKAKEADADYTVLRLGNRRIFIKDPLFAGQNEYYYQLFKNLNDVTIDGITIRGYRGTHTEGPIQNYGGKLMLKNCKIIDNEGIRVSAIYSCWKSKLYLENTLIAKNRNLPATSASPYTWSYGTRVYCGTIYTGGYTQFNALNSTIADNINDSQPFVVQRTDGPVTIQPQYGAIFRQYQEGIVMKNSIMWGNGINAQDIMTKDFRQGTFSITYCDIQCPSIWITSTNDGYYRPIYLDTTQPPNMSVDPQFVNPSIYDYNIGELSPCNNTGENGTDMGAKFE